MMTSVAKWGNSHAIRLSKDVMKQAKLTVHDKLSINIADDDTITIKKIPRTKAERFIELYGDFKGDWKSSEIDTGSAMGKEAIE